MTTDNATFGTMQPFWLDLDAYVARFEAALELDPEVNVVDFAPPQSQAAYLEVARELVRVDLEYRWQQGQPRALADYQRDFPALFADAESLQAITFEEYRLRCELGDEPSFRDYERQFGIDPLCWPLSPSELAARRSTARDRDGLEKLGHARNADSARNHSTPSMQAGDALAASADTLQVGERFLGFRLIRELGHGAFARVFLAEQDDLADRRVALKISPWMHGEPRSLARLQHTNIVPIHSVHRTSTLQAVCMPYLGSVTWSDLLRSMARQEPSEKTGRLLVETLCRHQLPTETMDPHARPNRGWPALTNQAPAFTTSDAAEKSMTSLVDTSLLGKLAGRTYVEAVLWLGARLAEGLAHAHERGILHRDLKPANILITDDGQPMLLDFNLACDLESSHASQMALVGGTLPYMAPEHLAALRGEPVRGAQPNIDARCDIYSLGVILFETLTGGLPWKTPEGSFAEIVGGMIADRQGGMRAPQHGVRGISPAVASILGRCLAPDPSRRYQSARELREDLDRQLRHLPLAHAPDRSPRERLSKWRRRHPRLSSVSVVAFACALVLGLVLVGYASTSANLRQLAARETLRDFQGEVGQIRTVLQQPQASARRTQDALRRCRSALERYRVLEDANWQSLPGVQGLTLERRAALSESVAELLLIWARAEAWTSQGASGDARESKLRLATKLNGLVRSCYPAEEMPRAVLLQQAMLARLSHDDSRAAELGRLAGQRPMESARDLYLSAAELVGQQEYRAALQLLDRASSLAPEDYATWQLRGHCELNVGQYSRADQSYTVCIALAPTSEWSYLHRGIARLEERDYPSALADFDRVLKLNSQHPEAHTNRGLALIGLRRFEEAVDELTQAMALGERGSRMYLIRAMARDHLADRQRAEQDRRQALDMQPVDDLDWVARGTAKIQQDPEGALADFDRALALNPQSRQALENKAHVLSERMGRVDEALDVLNRAVALYPDYILARAGRGVLLARQGQRDLALSDARECLARDTQPFTCYQVAGIHALFSTKHNLDRLEALRLLGAALKQGVGLNLVDIDPDLNPIRELPEFKQLVDAARALANASSAAGTTD